MGIPRPNSSHVGLINKSPVKRFVWYFIIAAFIVALPVLALFIEFWDVGFDYFLFQLISAVLGSIHVYYINEKLDWTEELVFWKKLLYTYGIAMFGMMLFYLISKFWVLRKHEGYPELYATADLTFIIPFFVIATFEKVMSIEPQKYKLWFFSDNINAPDPDLIDFSNSYLISFEFPKKYNDQVISNFKFKAPVDMQFGDLFYNYIKEYNDAYRESPIEYQDNMSNSYGWLFSIKKKSWWQNTRILDPHLSIRQNKIMEHDIIVPKRFMVE